jgi:HAD superfamily hydrolase (TIGR01509 family)
MIKALVFDFDGLILETEAPIYQSWVELYASFGHSLSFSTWATTIGTYEADFDPYIDLERQVGRKLDWDELEPRRQRRELSLVDAQPILPGVEACLEEARRLGVRIGLASSSTCAWVQGHLSRLGIREYFQSVRGKEDVARTKPDPALYLAVLADLDVPPEQAVALEDSPNGILAAKRAGMYCVAVPNPLTRQLDLSQADLCLESLAEISLQDLLARFGDSIS